MGLRREGRKSWIVTRAPDRSKLEANGTDINTNLDAQLYKPPNSIQRASVTLLYIASSTYTVIIVTFSCESLCRGFSTQICCRFQFATDLLSKTSHGVDSQECQGRRPFAYKGNTSLMAAPLNSSLKREFTLIIVSAANLRSIYFHRDTKMLYELCPKLFNVASFRAVRKLRANGLSITICFQQAIKCFRPEVRPRPASRSLHVIKGFVVCRED